jgi:release factor glutamine methyltransferase
MKIKEIIKAFSDIGSTEPEREACLTVEYLFGTGYASLLADPERKFDKEKINEVLSKRKEHIPLQYIFGEWYFMGEKFFVSRDCLIPRQDTEILVENAINVIKKGGRIADLCTGSGCIGISVLLNRSDITDVTLVDISESALNMARKNAAHNGVDQRFCGILGDVTDKSLLGDKKYAAIISNPPYIRHDVVPTLSREVSFEPTAALDGGVDGLDFYRAIVSNFAANLDDGGKFIFEIGYDQAEDLKNIAKEHGFCCRIVRDLGGNDRVAVLWRE